MSSAKQPIRAKLDEELKDIHFTLQEEVIKQAFPLGWRGRLKALWNKELRIPLAPVGLAVAGLAAVMIMWTDSPPSPGAALPPANRELIQAAGSIYWKHDYEKAVASLDRNR
jgi:hypothetical protein